jgi:hypothetical protein
VVRFPGFGNNNRHRLLEDVWPETLGHASIPEAKEKKGTVIFRDDGLEVAPGQMVWSWCGSVGASMERLLELVHSKQSPHLWSAGKEDVREYCGNQSTLSGVVGVLETSPQLVRGVTRLP